MKLIIRFSNTVWFHRNISHAFQTILKDEGGFFSGCLYKGLPPTVMVCWLPWGLTVK